MGENVFANGNAISCKAGDGKVVAAGPDVCLSPPSPPTGPIPVPYVDTSFSKDLKSGSSTVKINKKPVALRDRSFFKTSPLGNEPATRSFGASVVTHQITGKTYFAAWSMDVMFEGKNVCRHLDITTSNHGSQPGGTPPIPEAEDSAIDGEKEAKEESLERDKKNGYDHEAGTRNGKDVTSYQLFEKPPKRSELIYAKLPDHSIVFAPRPTNRRFGFGRQRGATLPHSMLTKGGPVLGAGECATDENGNVVEANNQSGHYQPDVEHLKETKKNMEQQGHSGGDTKWSIWDAETSTNIPMVS